jgi:hypothetical protein
LLGSHEVYFIGIVLNIKKIRESHLPSIMSFSSGMSLISDACTLNCSSAPWKQVCSVGILSMRWYFIQW